MSRRLAAWPPLLTLVTLAFFQPGEFHGDPRLLPLALDIPISPEFTIAADVTTPNSDTINPGRAGIAFDGTNYLVVSCRDQGVPAQILGVMVSPTGVVHHAFGIAGVNPIFGCLFPYPSVAFDGNNFLVVFGRDSEIWGARVTRSGVSMDGPDGFRISSGNTSSTSNFFTAVAFDGSNYLVVWAKFTSDSVMTYDIHGAIVSPEGNIGPEIVIFEREGYQVLPSVTFDGINYVAVWYDEGDIVGARISQSGNVLDPGGIRISTAVGAQEYPHVIFDGVQYFVVWQDARSDPGAFPPRLDIYGARVSRDGTLLDGPPESGGIAINTAPIPKEHPRVAFDGKDYFCVWDEAFFYTPPIGIYGARVSGSGVLLDGPPESDGLLISQPSCFGCRLVFPEVAFDGNTVFASWVSVGNTKDVIGALITPSRPVDGDGDGYLMDADCDDANPSINPGAVELPGNALDENCDDVLTCNPSAFYKTHGQFVRCVAQECRQLVNAGLVSGSQCDSLVSIAARSNVGKRQRLRIPPTPGFP